MESQPVPVTPQGVVRCYNLLPEGNPFLDEVLTGLSQRPRSLPAKYQFDERGLKLLEAVCTLPDYYPMRTEAAMLQVGAGDMAQIIGSEVQLYSYARGAGTGMRLLIDRLQPSLYLPVDIEYDALHRTCRDLAAYFPALNIAGLCADPSRPLSPPEFVSLPNRRKALFSPGWLITGLTRTQTQEFLTMNRRLLGTGGTALIGVDLKTGRNALEAAYEDAHGIAARFNLNLLERINRELAGDFQLSRFRYKASFDEADGSIALHFESLYSQSVRVAGQRFEFFSGETIHLGVARQHTVEEFHGIARKAGFSCEKVWFDALNRCSLHAMIAK